MNSMDYRAVFDAFRGMKVLVIGDVMVDAYLWGRVERISPEAPVPVVSVERRESRLGGAANVALNLLALGAEPLLLSFTGDDPRGAEFASLLATAGLAGNGIIRLSDRPTTTKFRVFGNKVQMLRVDEEESESAGDEASESLIRRFDALMEARDLRAVIFQDYDKGVISPPLIRHVVDRAAARGIPVAVDPKHRNFLEYKDVDLFKPNLKEMREGLKLDQLTVGGELSAAAASLQERLRARMLMVTLADQGVYIRSHSATGLEEHHLPAHVRNISDVSGAGDTVISVAALGLAAGLAPRDIASLSNRAGGLVCERAGVVPVDRQELLREIETEQHRQRGHGQD